MKKHLAIISMLIVSGAFVYFGGSSTPALAGTTNDEQAYVSYNDHFRQDTTPRHDTSKHKIKMKKKMKSDSTWRKDSVPQ